MLSKAYVMPVAPKNPGGSAASGVNQATLQSSLPQVQRPAKVGTSSTFLKDAIYYASTEFKPRVVIDVATLTVYVLIVHTSWLEFTIDWAMDIALGEVGLPFRRLYCYA